MPQNRSLPGTSIDPHGPPAPVSVLVAAHHPAVRSSLCGALAREPRFRPLMATADIRHAIRVLRSSAPDVVLVDRPLLGEPGLRRLPMLAAAAPDAVFLMVGMGDHPGYQQRAREAGAAGYLRLDQGAELLTAGVTAAVSARHD